MSAEYWTALEKSLRGLDRVMRRLAVVMLVLLAGLLGLIAGLLVAGDRAVAATEYVDAVRVEFGLEESSSSDLLAYGLAVCAGLEDGWSRYQTASWLSGTPYTYLGVTSDAAVFGQEMTELAIEALCPEVGR
jgi:hypothetical protein